MKILITGAYGFLGKNLIARLKEYGDKYTVYSYDLDTTFEELEKYTADCDFVFNFAAVHRPKENSEFEKVNHLFFDELLGLLKKYASSKPSTFKSVLKAEVTIFSSSTTTILPMIFK